MTLNLIFNSGISTCNQGDISWELACEAGIFWCVFSLVFFFLACEVRASAMRKPNRGQKRKRWGRGREEKQWEKLPTINPLRFLKFPFQACERGSLANVWCNIVLKSEVSCCLWWLFFSRNFYSLLFRKLFCLSKLDCWIVSLSDKSIELFMM